MKYPTSEITANCTVHAVKPLPAELPDEPAQASHTPVPWLVQVPCSSELTCRNIRGPSDEHVAKVGWRDYSEGQETDLANAALIVRAVNSHARLVAACVSLLDAYAPNAQITVDKSGEDSLHSSVRQARAALAAARLNQFH